MSLRGNLNSVDLANIFQMLSINQKEGTLNIFDGASKKSIYFSRDGVSMLSRGKQKKDTLGRILLRFDRLNETQLERALEKQDRSGRLLGVILEESELVPREVIEDALRIQIEEEIYNLFIWKDASFEFIEGAPPKEFDEIDGTITRLTFNVNSLIMEAARRIDEWEQIQHAISSPREVFQYSGENMELTDDIFREPYCEKVLAAINGRNTVEDIYEQSYVNRFEVYKILALLIDQKAIEPVPPGDLSDAAEAALERGAIPEAIKFFERVVELGSDSPETHRSLGRAYESLGEVARAAGHYQTYAEGMLELGQPQVAFDGFRQACDLLPTDLPAAERMITIYVENADAIEGQVRYVLDKGRQLAQIWVEIDEKNRAIETLHRVISLDPEDFSLRHLLVNIYLSANMSSEAIGEYEGMADYYGRKRDWDQVAKILRKILVIDRNRDDVTQRLHQLLNRKAKKKQNIRRLVVLVIVILGLSVLAYGYVNYELDARRQTAIAEQEATKMLEDLNGRVQPVRERLEELNGRLARSDADLRELVDVYRRALDLKEQYERGVMQAIEKFEEVASRYKFAQAKEEAVARKQELLGTRAGFESAITLARKLIQEKTMKLVDRAEEARLAGRARLALELYEKAWETAIDREPLERLEVDRKIENARELVGELTRLYERLDGELDGGEFAAAHRTALEVLNLYFATEVLNEVKIPVRVESSPPGARILVNGEDSGVLTPGWITYRPGSATEIALDLDGFLDVSELLPAARAELPDEELARIRERRVIRKDLKKEIEASGVLKGAVEAGPVVVDGVLYVATRSSRIWRLDPEDASPGVFVDVSDSSVSGIHSTPVVAGDSLYFATLEGHLRRVSLSTGRTVWERKGSAMVYAPLAAAGGLLLVGDEKGKITAHDVETGEPVWEQTVVGGIRCRPVVAGDRVLVATTQGRLKVYELESGLLLWESIVGKESKPIYGSPLASGERVYVGSTDGKLYALEPGKEEPVWVFDAGSEIRADPLLLNGCVVVTTIRGMVHAVREGTSVATLDLKVAVRNAPAPDGERMFFIGDSGRLVSAEFDGETFRTNWRHDIRGPEEEELTVRVSPTLVGNRIVVFAESGGFFVLLE